MCEIFINWSYKPCLTLPFVCLFVLTREQIEKEQARQRYMKLHAEGKTTEAQGDLARLAIIRKQREEAAKKKAAEKKGKLQEAKIFFIKSKLLIRYIPITFPCLPNKVKTQCISDCMQTTYFYHGKFLKKKVSNQWSSVTKGSVYHVKHMSIQPFTMRVD